jgi:hypothetical protein
MNTFGACHGQNFVREFHRVHEHHASYPVNVEHLVEMVQ